MSTYSPIQAITLTSTATEVNFTGIPQSFTDLVLVSNTIGTASLYALRLNADTSSLYSRTRMVGDGTSATSSRQSGQGDIIIDNLSSTNWGMNTIHFMNYSNITTNKTILARTGIAATDTAAVVGLYRSTAPITSIRLYMASNSFSSGSTFTLYGIASGTPKAFGGDEVRTDGTYWYHIYRSTGRFEPFETISNADVLVVAGGGGAAGNMAGGGGAGGYRYLTGQTLNSNTSSTISVGAGGTGSLDFTSSTSGTNSSFGATVSLGGGAGRRQTTGVDGGSGGGVFGTTGGLGTTGQGNNGGSSGLAWSGGGGGATAIGGTGTASASGSGGNGSATASAIGIATSTGQNSGGVAYFSGGGGGGGGFQGYAAGGAGLGGGGVGGNATTGGNGTANTGGGAGGGGYNGGTAFTGGNGGSGIVIVRYAV